MDHYIYVSQNKLDVFGPQLPKRWRPSLKNLKAGGSYAGVEFTIPDTPSDALRIGLLSKLCDHIRQTGSCGTIRDEGEFVYDVLLAKLFRHTADNIVEEGQVCFAGPYEEGGFAFFGSERHLIGDQNTHRPTVGSALAGWTLSRRQYEAFCEGWNNDGAIKVEVLAKRHRTFQFSNGAVRFVTGSPIYVALV